MEDEDDCIAFYIAVIQIQFSTTKMTSLNCVQNFIVLLFLQKNKQSLTSPIKSSHYRIHQTPFRATQTLPVGIT